MSRLPSPTLVRRLSGSTTDHLTRTALEPRAQKPHKATITAVRDATADTRLLSLVAEPDEDRNPLRFLPGQWVDFIIEPGVVGGYSFCSAPSALPEFELAVKVSSHPPAAWVHSAAAAPGTVVEVVVGGSFSYDFRQGLNEEGVTDVVMIAGGVGINPLLSIARTLSADVPVNAHLVYSTKTPEDVMFGDVLKELEGLPNFDVRLHHTKDAARLDFPSLFKTYLETTGADARAVRCLLCGPPPMAKDVEDAAAELDIKTLYEKWW